jgi:hypothetical protein
LLGRCPPWLESVVTGYCLCNSHMQCCNHFHGDSAWRVSAQHARRDRRKRSDNRSIVLPYNSIRHQKPIIHETRTQPNPGAPKDLVPPRPRFRFAPRNLPRIPRGRHLSDVKMWPPKVPKPLVHQHDTARDHSQRRALSQKWIRKTRANNISIKKINGRAVPEFYAGKFMTR